MSKKNTKNKQKPQELCNTYQHEHKQKYHSTVGTETREDCLNQENESKMLHETILSGPAEAEAGRLPDGRSGDPACGARGRALGRLGRPARAELSCVAGQAKRRGQSRRPARRDQQVESSERLDSSCFLLYF